MAVRSFKGVQTDINILAVILGLSHVAGLKYNQHQLAELAGVSKRTAEYATKRLEAAGVISRDYGRGRRAYVYQFSGVYHGRFNVRVFPHPCVRNMLVILTDEDARTCLVPSDRDSVAKVAENLRLYG